MRYKRIFSKALFPLVLLTFIACDSEGEWNCGNDNPFRPTEPKGTVWERMQKADAVIMYVPTSGRLECRNLEVDRDLEGFITVTFRDQLNGDWRFRGKVEDGVGSGLWTGAWDYHRRSVAASGSFRFEIAYTGSNVVYAGFGDTEGGYYTLHLYIESPGAAAKAAGDSTGAAPGQ